MREYALPGMWVRERTVSVPLDWRDSGSASIEVFVRDLVDPDRRHDDPPLLVFLQGGPGGANPRPLQRDGWLAEALERYRVVLVDQRGTGSSTPLDAEVVAAHGAAGGELLAHFRADSIVRDLERVREVVYGGVRWASLAQSYGGWLTLTYLSFFPDALTACYVCGGIPGIPPSATEVYRRTFDRAEVKSRAFYKRFPHDVDTVSAIADLVRDEVVLLPDGDRLTVHRLQSLGIDLGMQPGPERMHWLLETAFVRPGRLSHGFLHEVLTRTSSAASPLFWTLQESIYGDPASGPTGWAAQRERERRPQFDPDRRPLLFTGEMAFPWMFEEVRLLQAFAPAVESLAARTDWSPLYDPEQLARNEVPLAAAVYLDDLYVDSGLQLDTLRSLGNARWWVTDEFEHDGIRSGRVFTHLRELVRDSGGERR